MLIYYYKSIIEYIYINSIYPEWSRDTSSVNWD